MCTRHFISPEKNDEMLKEGFKKLMEDYAISKQIKNAHLETTSFQAVDFYKKNGYEIFGKLNEKPPGHISYFLQKRL